MFGDTAWQKAELLNLILLRGPAQPIHRSLRHDPAYQEMLSTSLVLLLDAMDHITGRKTPL